nr:MAG TPA: hypothetical protein [Caudoviricetes sp.]
MRGTYIPKGSTELWKRLGVDIDSSQHSLQ